MGKIKLKEVRETTSGGATAAGRKTVLRSDKMEVARIFFSRGEGCEEHSHSEEQTVFVEQGRLEVTLGEGAGAQTYLVEPGQASFHGSRIPHRLKALEDTWVVSFKNLVDTSEDPEAGRLV